MLKTCPASDLAIGLHIAFIPSNPNVRDLGYPSGGVFDKIGNMAAEWAYRTGPTKQLRFTFKATTENAFFPRYFWKDELVDFQRCC